MQVTTCLQGFAVFEQQPRAQSDRHLQQQRSTSSATHVPAPHFAGATAADDGSTADSAAASTARMLMSLITRHVPAIQLAADSRSSSNVDRGSTRRSASEAAPPKLAGHASTRSASMMEAPAAVQKGASSRRQGHRAQQQQLAPEPVPLPDLPTATLRRLMQLNEAAEQQALQAARTVAWLLSHLLADPYALARAATNSDAAAKALLDAIYDTQCPTSVRVHALYGSVQHAAAEMYDAQQQVVQWNAKYREATGALLRHMASCGRALGVRADALARDVEAWYAAVSADSHTLLDTFCSGILSLEASRAGQTWSPGVLVSIKVLYILIKYTTRDL